ncbi:hypothetical protein CRENBAI_016894 [Crenichthys baileyi]|uniref:Uncharacterized protein n=1 Tax=Crenichthys baileyi TaxID=28760 RepID=A0AAV9RRC5_9TELE
MGYCRCSELQKERGFLTFPDLSRPTPPLCPFYNTDDSELRRPALFKAVFTPAGPPTAPRSSAARSQRPGLVSGADGDEASFFRPDSSGCKHKAPAAQSRLGAAFGMPHRAAGSKSEASVIVDAFRCVEVAVPRDRAACPAAVLCDLSSGFLYGV